MGNHGTDAGQAADYPHHSAGDYCIASAPQSRRVQGVDNGYVSIYGQNGEKEDGTVEAQVVAAAHYPAHNFAKNPFGELVLDSQEGKAAHEDYRREDQVEQQDIGHRGQPFKPKK